MLRMLIAPSRLRITEPTFPATVQCLFNSSGNNCPGLIFFSVKLNNLSSNPNFPKVVVAQDSLFVRYTFVESGM